MTQLSEDLRKLAQDHQPEPESSSQNLLSKYGIPIQNLDFAYINKCENVKELRKIYEILQSGEEGYYPQLMKCAEDRLALLNPNCDLLRKKCPIINLHELDSEEQKAISSDLKDWLNDISRNNKELENRKSNTIHCDTDVRQCKDLKFNQLNNKPSQKRINSTDYQSWDKYDPDTEIMKQELEEERLKKEMKQKEEEAKAKPKKSITFNKFSTEAEAIFMSNREREKGNEYFKVGDYDEALQCYNNSIKCKKTIHNLNNRAVTYFKLKNYNEALKDCEAVLALDGHNEKALLRKAEILNCLGKHLEANGTVNSLIRVNPNNVRAQELSNSLQAKCVVEKKRPTRMVIEEVSDDEDDD